MTVHLRALSCEHGGFGFGSSGLQQHLVSYTRILCRILTFEGITKYDKAVVMKRKAQHV
jgi:hypothetical protein